jgi:hypothetical protein
MKFIKKLSLMSSIALAGVLFVAAAPVASAAESPALHQSGVVSNDSITPADYRYHGSHYAYRDHGKYYHHRSRKNGVWVYF